MARRSFFAGWLSCSGLDLGSETDPGLDLVSETDPGLDLGSETNPGEPVSLLLLEEYPDSGEASFRSEQDGEVSGLDL